MGYCVSMEISGVIIPHEKVAECLAVINDLNTSANKNQFSWVSYPEDKFKTLRKAIEGWRYVGDFNEDGHFVIEYFEGEKCGDDEILYEAIAPFIDNGTEHPGLITCRGEDGEQWRYAFENGKVENQQAKIIWE